MGVASVASNVKGAPNWDRVIVLSIVVVSALTAIGLLQPTLAPCDDIHMCLYYGPGLATYYGYPALVVLFFLLVVRSAGPRTSDGTKGQLGDARLPPPP